MKKALRLMLLGMALCGLAAAFAAADELTVGGKAPNFSLQASDGKTYSLADFQGKQAVVLAWFPKATRAAVPSSPSRSQNTAT